MTFLFGKNGNNGVISITKRTIAELLVRSASFYKDYPTFRVWQFTVELKSGDKNRV